MSGYTLRLLILILFGSIGFHACHKPSLLLNGSGYSGNVYTDCVNFERHAFLDTNLPLPLAIKQEKSLRGLSNPTLLNIADWIILTTRNGFLHIISSTDPDDDQNTRISPAISTSPTRYGHLLFIASELGIQGLKAYDLQKGKIVWALHDYQSKSSPVVADNRVIHAGLNGRVIALNMPSGDVIWETDLKDKIVSNLAYRDGYLVAVTQNGILCTLDATSGSSLWTLDLADAFYTHPVIGGKKIFLASYHGIFYSIHLTKGTIEKELSCSVPFYCAPSYDGNRVYLSKSNGMIEAINAQSFRSEWSTGLKGPASVGSLVTRDYLLCSTGQKKFYVLNKYDGTIVQQIDIKGKPRSMPVVIDNRLLLSYEQDELAVFGLSGNTQ